MPGKTAVQPEDELRALETVINRQFKAVPLTFKEDDYLYRMTELRQGAFHVTQLDLNNNPVSGGITQLPCNEHYVGLIFDQWIGVASKAATQGRGG